MAEYYPSTGNSGDEALHVGPARLRGIAIREAASIGADAAIILRDGDDATDPMVLPLEVAANRSAFHWFGSEGIEFDRGVFLDRVSGECQVVIYI